MSNLSSDSLSRANQLIHQQRNKIAELESVIQLLEYQVAEETRMRYTAWSKLAKVSRDEVSSS